MGQVNTNLLVQHIKLWTWVNAHMSQRYLFLFFFLMANWCSLSSENCSLFSEYYRLMGTIPIQTGKEDTTLNDLNQETTSAFTVEGLITDSTFLNSTRKTEIESDQGAYKIWILGLVIAIVVVVAFVIILVFKVVRKKWRPHTRNGADAGEQWQLMSRDDEKPCQNKTSKFWNLSHYFRERWRKWNGTPDIGIWQASHPGKCDLNNPSVSAECFRCFWWLEHKLRWKKSILTCRPCILKRLSFHHTPHFIFIKYKIMCLIFSQWIQCESTMYLLCERLHNCTSQYA